jgi:predicted MPP superfamily phosphohydrolase
MRAIGIIIFITVFLAVYGLINYYIFARGLQAIPPGLQWRRAYIAAFLVLALSIVAGRLLERRWPSPVSETLVWMGSFWLGAIIYLFLAVLALDILRLANQILPFYPVWIRQHYSEVKQGLLLSVSSLVILVLIAGYVNASIPRIRALTLRVPKKTDGLRSLTVAVASDIHLGTIIGRKRFNRVVERINALDADLVLLPGDIVDEDMGAVIRENLGESLKSIRSKYGVVAITGNHEYIGGVDKACAYLADHGVTVLRDAILKVNGGVFLVGREDWSSNQFGGMRRKRLAELMAEVDKTRPIILLDHQPFHLEEAAANGADVQLSGHTHNGQLWPFNYVTAAVYELSWGYKRVGQTHVIVSSGVGTWGPPARIGTRPEILHLTLTFD